MYHNFYAKIRRTTTLNNDVNKHSFARCPKNQRDVLCFVRRFTPTFTTTGYGTSIVKFINLKINYNLFT